MSFYAPNIGAYWRPHEEDAIKKYFGEEAVFDGSVTPKTEDCMFWRLNTEGLNNQSYQWCMKYEDGFRRAVSLKGEPPKVINPMSSFLSTYNKDACFKIWEEAGIASPKCQVYTYKEDITLEFPYLVRLNNFATGEHTFLVKNEEELSEADKRLAATWTAMGHTKIKCKKIAVEFIDTTLPDMPYTSSFRITVAGEKVVSGYARLSDDWLAITANFTEEHKKHFIAQNKRVQKLIKDNYSEIIRAVRCLGLHHVGIDAVADKDDNLYFLEVQPFYFAGDPNRTPPPFYNPYKPPLLVDWLINEKEDLYKEIPLYYDMWLDKEAHFDSCYKALAEYFDVRS